MQHSIEKLEHIQSWFLVLDPLQLLVCRGSPDIAPVAGSDSRIANLIQRVKNPSQALSVRSHVDSLEFL